MINTTKIICKRYIYFVNAFVCKIVILKHIRRLRYLLDKLFRHNLNDLHNPDLGELLYKNKYCRFTKHDRFITGTPLQFKETKHLNQWTTYNQRIKLFFNQRKI